MMRLPDLLATVNAGPGPVVLATLVRCSGPGAPRLGSRLLGAGLPALDVLETGRCQTLRRALDPAWGLAPGAEGVGEFLLERLVPRKLPPWLNFCAQVLDKGRSCVLVTVCATQGTVDYERGDHFAFDERNHGLLPMDRGVSLELQRACEEARTQGMPGLTSLAVTGGSLDLLLEPLAPVVPVVILAAGASRRLGTPKQLVRWQGQTLLRRVAGAALAGGGEVTVVTGCGAPEMAQELLGLPLRVLVNPLWEEGMAASIRAGVAALPASAGGVLLLACDQPAVDAALLARLQAAHREEPEAVVVCGYGGTRGTPALFPAARFPELLALEGDRGARALIQGAAGVRVLPFPGGEVDVDWPQDLPPG